MWRLEISCLFFNWINYLMYSDSFEARLQMSCCHPHVPFVYSLQVAVMMMMAVYTELHSLLSRVPQWWRETRLRWNLRLNNNSRLYLIILTNLKFINHFGLFTHLNQVLNKFKLSVRCFSEPTQVVLNEQSSLCKRAQLVLDNIAKSLAMAVTGFADNWISLKPDTRSRR